MQSSFNISTGEWNVAWPGRVSRLVLIAAPTKPFHVGTLDIKRMIVDPAALTDDLLREMGRTMMASRGYEAARRRAVEADGLERDLRPIMDRVKEALFNILGVSVRDTRSRVLGIVEWKIGLRGSLVWQSLSLLLCGYLVQDFWV